jgi:hypothetical protein
MRPAQGPTFWWRSLFHRLMVARRDSMVRALPLWSRCAPVHRRRSLPSTSWEC